METEEAIKTRRAIKAFDPHHVMTDEEKHKLLSLAILAPTAFNIQNWRYVIISDKNLRAKIKAVAWDQPQITDASLLIILCADLKAWQKNPARYWKHAPEEVKKIILPAIENYYGNKEQIQRDEAMRSCGIAAQTLMLCARSMGYDSCPMDGFDFDAVAKLIHLPDDHIISMFVAIGRATKQAWQRPGQLALSDVVIDNYFM